MSENLTPVAKIAILELAVIRSEYKEEKHTVKEIYEEMLALITDEE